MPKARVGQQIKEALHGKKAASSKSADIDFLTERFKQLKVKIRHLIEALRAQHLSLLRMNETRLLVSDIVSAEVFMAKSFNVLVAKRVAALANEGPVTSLAGTVPDEDLKSNSDDMSSYIAIHQNVHVRHRLYCDRFLEHVVEYAVEWERVVVSRVSNSLNRADKLRLDLDHYQTKVDTIRAEKTRRIAKGGMIDSKLAEKLYRNEAKLSHSRQKYETYASDLSHLIEEVTARGWKDLHPILLKVSQFDATLASDEHQLLSNLNQVASSLKQIATRYHLTPESRVKTLEVLTSKVLAAPSSSDENLNLIEDDEPKKDKEYYMESMNSRRLLESTSSSKENSDVVHGVMTSLKVGGAQGTGTSPPPSGTLLSQIGAVANAAPPPHAKTPTRRSSPRNMGGFSGKPKEMNIPSHSHSSSNSRMAQESPRRSSSRNRERASSRTPKEMNIPSHSNSSSNSGIAQESPRRSSSRNRERASSRTPRARRAPDAKSTVNPFDGLVEERRSNSSSGSTHNNYPPSPRGLSSREGRERSRYSDSSPRAAGHIPKSPRTPSHPKTPSNQAQYPEEHNPHHVASSPKNNLNSIVQYQNQHSTGQYQNYQDSGQYQQRDAPNNQGFDSYGEQQQQHQQYQQNRNSSGYEQRGRFESSPRHMNMSQDQNNYQYPPTSPIATTRQGTSAETSASKPWYQSLF